MIGFIHLSDIHIQTASDAVVDRIEKIAAAAAGRLHDATDVVFVVTGDVTFSGTIEQCTVARSFLEGVSAQFSKHCTVARTHFVVVPGNHDCDHTIDSGEVRDILISSASTGKIGAQYIEVCLQPQIHFHSSLSTLTDSSPLNQNTIGGITRIETQHGNLHFGLINSAWISKKEERVGSLYFPAHAIPNVSGASDEDITVLVMHHPVHWQNPSQSQKMRGQIESEFDIVMTGHEHHSSGYSKSHYDGDEVDYLEGGCLQGHSQDADDSRFRVVKISTSDRSFKVFDFKYDGSIYTEEYASPTRILGRKIRRGTTNNAFTQQFEEFVSEFGTGIRHPRKRDICLRDLFIYPDLEEESSDNSSGARKVLRGSDIRDFVLRNSRLLISGSSKSGKTALAKTLCRDFRSSGIVPIFIEFEKCIAGSPDSVIEKIDRCVEEQYGTGSKDRIRQTPNNGRVLIVDNFARSGATSKAMHVFLDVIQAHFKMIVLFTHYRTELLEIFDPTTQLSALLKFESYSLLEFGHKLRWRTVDRWVRLSSDPSIEESKFSRDVESRFNQVSSVLRIGIAPSYPINIYTLLQELELQGTLASDSSAYGHLYERLVLDAVGELAKRSQDIADNYLAELSHRFHQQQSQEISADELMSWHKRYEEAYSETIDFEKWTNDLVRVRLLESKSGAFRFKYKYIFFFFLARYFRNNINNSDIREEIRALCKSMHNDYCCESMLMLCHLSKDDFIISCLLEEASDLFSDDEELDTEKPVSFLEAVSAAPLVIDSSRSDAKKNRSEQLDAMDASESGRGSSSKQDNEYSVDGAAESNIDDTSRSHAAASGTIRVLGQVLRNYSGSLKGERKSEVIEATTRLALRAMGGVIRDCNENQEEILKTLETAISDKWNESGNSPLSATEVRKRATSRLTSAVLQFSFAVIRHTAKSIGTERTTRMLGEVSTRMASASTLIDFSVRVEHSREFPENELSKMRKRTRNWFTESLLQWIVYDHVLLTYMPYDKRQRICSMVNIKVSERTVVLKQLKS